MTLDLDVVRLRRRLGALAALVLVAVAVPATAAGARPPAQPRVVDGTPAVAAQVPFLATVKSGGDFICGGSLVAADRVLTAAHCLPDLRIGDQVVVGPSDTRTIVHIAQDPNLTVYNDLHPTSNDVPPFDVGILQLNAPVTDVAPIRLAQAADAPLYAPGALLTTIGMGSTDEQGGGSGVLRYAQVQARADTDCKALLAPLNADSSFVPATMICTTDPDHTSPFRSGCFGDSGAPLVAVAPTGALVQVGVDDWGVHCGFRNGDPENYVEVPVIAGFALSPAPVFRPEPQGRPKLTGTVKVGHKVRCTTPKYNVKPDRLIHAFFRITSKSPRLLARKASYRIPHALRHRKLTCAVLAHSQGGELLTEAAHAKRIK